MKKVKVGDYIIDQFKQEYKVIAKEYIEHDILEKEVPVYTLEFTKIDRTKCVLEDFIKSCTLV